MREKVIFGLDQSTSATKLVVVNQKGAIIYKDSLAHTQHYPQASYVEHDMVEIRNNCLELLSKAYEFAGESYDIMNLSITNQRETIVFWDKNTGELLYNALVWQCRRGAKVCEKMISDGYEEMVMKKTGLKLDTYFSGSKIKWALEHISSVKLAKEAGNLAIGTVDAYLVYFLTGKKVFASDNTNASRTLLYNIYDNDWDDELLDLFEVTRDMLPHIKSCNDFYGTTDLNVTGFEVPIAGVIGDSQGALFGQQCFEIGFGKATYGTGSSILMYTGDQMVVSDKGIMTSIAWSYNGQTKYAIEGIINSSGDTLKWVKDNLCLYEKDYEVDEMISSLDSNEAVYIVPAFSGLGAPYWQAEARASIVGMTRKSGKAHIIRAAVESMAYQVADLVSLMEEEAGAQLKVLNVDGGPTSNEFLMQLQTDLLSTPLQRRANTELSVMGAIYLGGLKMGMWTGFEDLKRLNDVAGVYEPRDNKGEMDKLMDEWHEAVNSVIRY